MKSKKTQNNFKCAFHSNRKSTINSLVKEMQLLETKEQFQLLFDPTTDRHVVFDTATDHLHYTTSLKDAESFFKQKVQ